MSNDKKTYYVEGVPEGARHTERIASGLSSREAADRVAEAAVTRGWSGIKIDWEAR